MTIAELIAELQGFDPDTMIIQSKDAEGNSFSPLSGIAYGWYFPENEDSGDWKHDGAENDPEYEWDGPRESDTRAICLWPEN